MMGSLIVTILTAEHMSKRTFEINQSVININMSIVMTKTLWLTFWVTLCISIQKARKPWNW